MLPLALGAGQPLGVIAGLIVGGIICQTSGSWRSIYWIQAGLSFLFAAMGWWSIPKNDIMADDSLAKRVARIDWTGAVLSTVSFVLFAFCFTCVFLLLIHEWNYA
jgi:MFS family permease